MSKQVPAYELANAIEEAMVDGFAFGYIGEAVAMLRKLQAENDALKAKSLTDTDIALIWANYEVPMTGMDFKKLVEAIFQKANNG